MNFSFDGIGEKINNVFHSAVKKTNNAVETAKISYSVSEIKNDLKEAYANLGKKIYECSDNIECTDIENEKFAITQLIQELQLKQEELSLVKCSKKCENCGALISKNDSFCKNCGTKI